MFLKNAACLAFAVAGCYRIVSAVDRALLDLPEEALLLSDLLSINMMNRDCLVGLLLQ